MMYTRSFFAEGSPIPEGYDGEALRENESIPTSTIQPTSAPPKISPQAPPYNIDEEESEEVSEVPVGSGTISSFLEKNPFKRFFNDLNIHSLAKIELEDIIIISIAALLFFSEGGDRVLALMLIALLFVGKDQ